MTALLAGTVDATIMHLRVRGKLVSQASNAPSLPYALIGINEGFLYNTDWARDFWWSGVFQTAGGAAAGLPNSAPLYRNYDGCPTTYAPGETSIKWFAGTLPRDATRAGVYTLTYPPGMTVSLHTANGATVTQAFSGGTGKINLTTKTQTDQVNNTAYFALMFSGPIPAGGIKLSLTKDGDVGTNIYSDQAAAALKALGKINRSMSSRGVNGDDLGTSADGKSVVMRGAATRYHGPSSGEAEFPMCVEIQTDVCNQNGQHMWHNQSHIDDDSVVAAEAAYVAANLNTSKVVFVELSNELWNTGFGQTRLAKCMGVRLGLAPVAATPGALVQETIIYNGFGNSSVTNYACAVGDKIFMGVSGRGWVVMQCLVAQPAGTTITVPTTVGQITNDHNWLFLYDNGGTLLAHQRWIAKRSKEIWAIWDAAMVAAGRPRSIHVIGHQAAVPLSRFVTPVLDWDNTYKATDRVAIAPYWGGGVGGYDLGAYGSEFASPPYSHPWTPTEKDLIAKSKNAFIDAFFGVATDAVDAAVASCVSRRSELATYLSRKGWDTVNVKICSYESNWHVAFNGWPSDEQSQWAGVQQSIMRDGRFGDLVTGYFNGLIAGGGEHLAFDRIGPPTTVYVNNKTSWAFQEYDTDQPPRFAALSAVNAATK